MRKYFSFFEFYYYVIKRSPKRYNISANGQLNQLAILMTPLVLWMASMFIFIIFGHGWATGVFIGLGVLMILNVIYSTTVYKEAISIELELAKERRRLAEEERERELKKEQEERRRKHHEEMKAWEEKLKRDSEDLKRQQQEQRNRTYGASGRASSFGAGGSGGFSGKSKEQMEAEERLRQFAEQFNSEEFHRAQEKARQRAEQQRRNDAQYNRIANHYAILGIEPTKDLDIVKKAYRKKAKQYHPDTGGDAEMFKKITIANEEILKFIKSI